MALTWHLQDDDDVATGDGASDGALLPIFLVPAREFLVLVRNAYGVRHPSGPFWRNRFFASLLEPVAVDFTY